MALGIIATTPLQEMLEENNIKYDASNVISTSSLRTLHKALVSAHGEKQAETLLEAALKGSKLNITAAKTAQEQTSTPDVMSKRREYLKKKGDERAYSKMVSNLPTPSAYNPDDTMRSAKYITSVAANMIIAPISFGVFLYSFGGGVFGEGNKVIVGVLGGVAMLFVEM